MPQLRIPPQVLALGDPGSPVPLQQFPTPALAEALPLPLTAAQFGEIVKLHRLASIASVRPDQKAAVETLHASAVVATGMAHLAQPAPANGQPAAVEAAVLPPAIGLDAILGAINDMRLEARQNHELIDARITQLERGLQETRGVVAGLNNVLQEMRGEVAEVMRESRVLAAFKRNEVLTTAGQALEHVPCMPGLHLPAAFVEVQAFQSEDWRYLPVAILDQTLEAYGLPVGIARKEQKMRALWAALGGVGTRVG